MCSGGGKDDVTAAAEPASVQGSPYPQSYPTTLYGNANLWKIPCCSGSCSLVPSFLATVQYSTITPYLYRTHASKVSNLDYCPHALFLFAFFFWRKTRVGGLFLIGTL